MTDGSAVRSPCSTTRSASFPGSTVPNCCATPRIVAPFAVMIRIAWAGALASFGARRNYGLFIDETFKAAAGIAIITAEGGTDAQHAQRFGRIEHVKLDG